MAGDPEPGLWRPAIDRHDLLPRDPGFRFQGMKFEPESPFFDDDVAPEPG